MKPLTSSKAFILSAFLVGLTSSTFGQSSVVTANFGNPPKGGGACSGKGLCSVSPVNPDNTDGINATFQLSPTDNTLLNMTFSLVELNQKQPEQTQFINPNVTTYNFDGPFDLISPVFAPLHLEPGAAILPSTPSTITFNGNMVTISFRYAHN